MAEPQRMALHPHSQFLKSLLGFTLSLPTQNLNIKDYTEDTMLKSSHFCSRKFSKGKNKTKQKNHLPCVYFWEAVGHVVNASPHLHQVVI